MDHLAPAQQRLVDRITEDVYRATDHDPDYRTTLTHVAFDIFKRLNNEQGTCKCCDKGGEIVVTHVMPKIRAFTKERAEQNRLLLHVADRALASLRSHVRGTDLLYELYANGIPIA